LAYHLANGKAMEGKSGWYMGMGVKVKGEKKELTSAVR
jgi:hypothetical protein